MPKAQISTLEKIRQSEEKIKELIQQRQQELVNIITKYKALDIDNKLLAGFLLFMQDPANLNHPILSEFKQLTNRTKTPSTAKS